MKTCPRCTKTLPLGEFPWRNEAKGTRNSWCKACFRERGKRWYKDNTEKQKQAVSVRNAGYKRRNQRLLCEYLFTHPCIDCGETDIVVLQFDHVDDNKVNNVTTLASRHLASFSRIEEEIAKCEVVCANCHSRRTASRANSYRVRYLSGEDYGEQDNQERS